MLTFRKISVHRKQLQPGDHVCTDCKGGLYTHHGIYVGKAKVTNPYIEEEKQEIDDAVIHLVPPEKSSAFSSSFSSSSSSSSGYITFPCQRCFHHPQIHGVIITCLDCFLNGNSLYTCHNNDGYRDPPDKVIQKAFAVLEKKIYFPEYNVVSNNCEHFANYCETGNRSSDQIETVQTITGNPVCCYL